MRFVQVISSVDPEWGGAAVGALEINRALVAKGVDATLVSAGYPVGSSITPSSLHRVVAARPSRPYSAENSWSFFPTLRSVLSDADFVHISGTYRIPPVAAALSARRMGIPYSVQLHGVLEPFQLAEEPRKKRVFDSLIGKRYLNSAAFLMVAGAGERTNAEAIYPTANFVTNPLGSRLDEPEPHPDAQTRIGSLQRANVVLFLGRYASKKRPDLLLKSWARLGADAENRVLVLAGPDGDWTKSSLLNLARDLGISDSVVICGHASGREKSWLMQRSGIFVLPSDNENFGITVAEAMLAGCHVITTTEVGAGEHLRASASGSIVGPGDPDGLASRLRKGLICNDLREESGRRAKAYANQTLTWAATASRLEAAATTALESLRNRSR